MSSSVEFRPKTEPRTAVITLAALRVLPSLDASSVSDNRRPSKPRLLLFPTKRRLPDDLVRQRKRLQTDLLRQSCSDLMRFRHASPSIVFPQVRARVSWRDPENSKNPRRFSSSSPDPASPNPPEGVLERSRKGLVYNPKTLHATTDLVRTAAHFSPPLICLLFVPRQACKHPR